MPVNSHHPDYDANLPAWLRARDVIAGEDAVKAAGIKYLPRLDAQTDDEYNAYKMRASFFNATARTADGYTGLIFRREPAYKLPDTGTGVGRALAGFVQDADLLGTALSAYAKNIVNEVITVGRVGTLVDWEDTVEKRAYAVRYEAEQIINWHTERVNGRNVLTLVVLKEVSQNISEATDVFQPAIVEQLRVLKLVPTGTPAADGKQAWTYQVEVWRQQKQGTKKSAGTEWELAETRTPLRRGKPLPLIPFVFHGPRHLLPTVDKLPLADIIYLNLDHYRLNADYHHGLHFTALPTAYLCGFPKDTDFRIGSSVGWVSEATDAKAGFLEFTGQGLTTFERAMDRVEQNMALMGSRMLEAQKRVGETADAIELRQSGENSVLSAVSLSVSDSLTHVLRWIYWWNSTEPLPEAIGDHTVLVSLNTDFSAKGMASNEITAIVAAWKAGAISQETMFDLFRMGEVLPVGRSNEDEARLLAKPKVEMGKTASLPPGTTNIQQPTSNAEQPMKQSQSLLTSAATTVCLPRTTNRCSPISFAWRKV
jgi:hypothetical protein